MSGIDILVKTKGRRRFMFSWSKFRKLSEEFISNFIKIKGTAMTTSTFAL